MLVFTGCSNPADKVPAAEVSAASTNETAATAPTPAPGAAATTTPAAPAAAATHYAATGEGGTIEFTGSKVTGSHSGGFKAFVAEFAVQNGKLADQGNRVVIDMTTTWSDNDRLTGHLKNADFFDVEKFPNAIFETLSIKDAPSGSTVTGNLTLHGVTKKIVFPAKIAVAPESVTVNAEFAINRMDFDIKYPGRADDLIREEVVLRLKLKATPGRADFKTVEKMPVPAPPAA